MQQDEEYLTTRVLSASPAELHLMTVDGALRHASHAKRAIETGDTETAAAALASARGFVTELISGLNQKAEPELVGGVASLFVFALRRLAEAELKPTEPALVADAITTLAAHREAWKELIDSGAADEPPRTTSPGVELPKPHASFAATTREAPSTGGFSFLG
ncbi:MAG: flagellar export chaperone FliS [Planctomycetota bacterium]